MEATTAVRPIMTRLKEDTAKMHAAAEGQQLEQAMMKGTLPKEVFVKSLGQRLLLHRAIEPQLAAARAQVPAIAAVVKDEQWKAPYLEADLRFFGTDPNAVTPLPATTQFLAEVSALAARSPLALLGVWYVFEGSTNGARYIAKAIRKAYNLEGEAGTTFLDPYGEEQRGKWAAFRETMNALPFTEPEMDLLVEAAGATFTGIMHIDREVYAG